MAEERHFKRYAGLAAVFGIPTALFYGCVQYQNNAAETERNRVPTINVAAANNSQRLRRASEAAARLLPLLESMKDLPPGPRGEKITAASVQEFVPQLDGFIIVVQSSRYPVRVVGQWASELSVRITDRDNIVVRIDEGGSSPRSRDIPVQSIEQARTEVIGFYSRVVAGWDSENRYRQAMGLQPVAQAPAPHRPPAPQPARR